MTQHSTRAISPLENGSLRSRIDKRSWQVRLVLVAALLLTVAFLLHAGSTVHAADNDVSGVTLTSPNPGELVITWDAPSNAPDDYRVTWKKSSAKWPSYKNANTVEGGNAFPTGTSHTVTGLEEGTAYKARVRARYSSPQLRTGPWSDTATLAVAGQPAAEGDSRGGAGTAASDPSGTPPPVRPAQESETTNDPREREPRPQRLPSRNFLGQNGLTSANADPEGIAGWRTWLYVVDNRDAKLYVYRQSNGAFHDYHDLPSENDDPYGIVIIGDDMWVADDTDNKLYHYTINNNGYISAGSDDIGLPSGNRDPTGLAARRLGGSSTGSTAIYILDSYDEQVYVHVIGRGSDSSLGFDLADDFDDPWGIWIQGDILWTTDENKDHIRAYDLSTTQATKPPLSRRFIDLAPENTDARGLWSDGTKVWVLDDDDDRLYRYELSTQRDREADQDLSPSNDEPRGMTCYGALSDLPRTASIGPAVHVIDGTDDKAYGYRLLQRPAVTRLSAMDFDMSSHNATPFGITTDGTTVFVSDDSDDNIYRYGFESGNVLSATFGLDDNNEDPRGIWRGSTHTYVVDADDNQVYVYNNADRTLSATRNLVSKNVTAFDIWSTGTIVYIIGIETGTGVDKLFAYRPSDFAPIAELDIRLSPQNRDPTGLCGMGNRLWVADDVSHRLYAYRVVRDVNTEPSFAVDSITYSVNENATPGTEVGSPISVEDDGDVLEYSLSGTHAAYFEIDSATGQITVGTHSEGLDFETTPVMSVTLEVTDNRDNAFEDDPSVDDTVAVTINLNNVQEEGLVTVDVPEGGEAKAGVTITATVTDPDGGISDQAYEWQRWNSTPSRWEAISGATSRTYAPVSADIDRRLRVMATYSDAAGQGSVTSTGFNVVVANMDPEFASSSTDRSVDENLLDAFVGAPVIATDPDEDPLKYSITGDVSYFDVSSRTGQIQVRDGILLDFETDTTYTVVLHVTDEKNDLAESDSSIDDTITVGILVRNVDEDGVVELRPDPPVLGRVVTASLSDPDDGVSNLEWQWQERLNAGSWTDISGADSRTFRSSAKHLGNELRAVASYDDDHGGGKSAMSEAATVVPANNDPYFQTQTVTRSVDENAVGAAIGAVVVADDDDDDALFYSIAGTDASLFAVNSGTGQISVAAGSSLDYETKSSYSVSISVSDRKNAFDAADTAMDDSVTVLINVTNIDEDGSVTVSPQPVTGTVSTAEVTDPDAVNTSNTRGTVSNVTSWAWEVGAAEDSVTWTTAAGTGATTASYSPVVTEQGKWLRVTAIYDDPVFSTEATVRAIVGPVTNVQVEVSFAAASYTVAEGSAVTVTVELDTAPQRQVVVPLTKANQGGASDSDYSGVPASVTFGSGDTSKTFTFTATDDDANDDGESVLLGFGTLPAQVSEGAEAAATVVITDTDVPDVEVSFAAASYTVAEGSAVTVTVELDTAPQRQVVVPLTKANQGGASDSDYSGVPASVTFGSGDTSKTFTFTATDDDANDDGESVLLGFGTLPAQVSEGAEAAATVVITDTDVPDVEVSFAAASYTVAEGSAVTVTVELDTAPQRQVVVPLTKANQGGASDSDYSGVPASVTFGSGDMSKTFTFTATDDSVDDDGESVELGFGTLPTLVTAGSTATTTVRIADADDPAVTVSFGAASYTVAEGDDVTVTVELSADPERSVTVTLTATNQDDATSGDYSIPASVTFDSGETSKTFTFSATDDSVDDDGESVLLSFGTLPTLVSAGTPATTTVRIADDDDPAVTVSFGAVSHSVAEGDDVTVTVELSADPEREVTVPLTATNQGGATDADYSGVPASVTFDSGDTSKTFTFSAVDDSVDDDGESVLLSFGTLPTLVSAGTPATTTVRIADDDDPAVTVSFGAVSYTVAEGDGVTVTVELSADPEREVTVPLTATNQDDASDADYSGVPASVTFDSGDTSKTFTFSAVDDSVDDDGESVLLSFGTLPTLVSAGAPATTTVRIADADDPAVTVSFGAASYTVAEGDDVTVTVELSADPERSVTVTLTATNQDDATSGDYSIPASVTFDSGETSKTFTFSAVDDSVDDDGESVLLSFGMLPTLVSAGTPATTTVRIADDDDPAVTVSFGRAAYTVAEGGGVTVTVELSADPERSVTVPLTATNQGGATDADYSGVPASVTFDSGETSKTFTFTATDDSVDDDGESVLLSFGTLPTLVSAGTPATTTVRIADDDDPAVTVSFGAVSHSVAEGDGVTVTVELSADPEREVTVPLTATNQGGATSADYSGVPASVTFDSGDASKTFTFTATDDSVDDDGESVLLSFGTLPTLVSAGTPATTTVRIADDDDPAVTVSFGAVSHSVAEGDGVTVTVELSADPEREVTVPLTATNQGGATDADYSGVPASVTFDSGDTSKTFTFSATDDSVDDDGESVLLSFGTLPTLVSAGTPATTTVRIADADDPAVTVSFGAAFHTVAEGDDVTVTVELSADPEREVTVPLTATNQGGATDADYSGVPASVTFDSGDTSKTFTFSAVDDSVDDDGESVLLGLGTLPTLVSAGAPATTTVRIADADDPAVTVSFGAASYTVAEGGGVTVTVELSADPEREVTVPLTATNQDDASDADYSGVPANVTFDSGETSKTFTFSAVDDTVDDDGESVLLSFGTLPTLVSAGTPATSTVRIADDDDPAVTVSFGAASYTVAEGDDVTVTVELSADPERSVTFPLTATNENGATSADYSGVPNSVTFESGDTSRSFTFAATDDAIDDDGERVKLAFGTLPTGITAGTTSETVVSITDDDLAATVKVRFDQSTYSATEGGDDAVVTVILDSPAKSQVEIPLTANGHGGATKDDWSGVPETVSFDTGDNSKSFTVTAFDDNVEDNGEMVELGFGTLPTGFAPGSPSTAKITLMNDDSMGVGGTTGQNRVCTKGEITVRGQTDRWVWRITDSSYWDEYTIDLMGMHSNKGTLRDPHIVYTANIYTHDGFYPPGPAYGSFPSYASNDGGAGWDSSIRLRFRNRTGSYSYFPGKEPELDTGYYTALVGANPFGDGANGLGSYTLCIEGPGSISEVDQPELRIVVSAAHLDVSDGEPAQFNIKLGARPTGSVEVFMTKLEPASDSRYVVEPLMYNFTVDNWDIPQVVTVRRKSDYAPPLDDGFAIGYWGKGGGYDKEFEFLEVYDRVPQWMKQRLTYDPEPALTGQDSEAQKQNTPATGGPGISGTPLIGETLTATTSGIQDEDGLTDADFAYQWVRSELGSNAETDIAGATGSSYAVTSDDAGKAIKVRVTFTDDAGNEESLTSFGVIAAPALPDAQAPGAPGRPDVAREASGSLSVSWDAPSSDGGSAVTGYKVQWKEAADSWDTPADVSEAVVTGTGHTIAGLTDGVEYSVRVIAANEAGDSPPSTEQTGTPNETVPPELSEASVDGAALTLTFNEDLDGNSALPTTAFTVTVSGNVRAVDSVEVTGGAVALTLASAVMSQDTVTVSYAAPSGESADRLRDSAGNAAASFTGQNVTNETAAQAAFTASVHDVPDSHDGQTAVTFELRFSEAPKKGFSYKTLRDHAFTVTGGSVTRAVRMEKGNNIRWTIHVEPDPDADLTVVLPITVGCDAQGAICTGDGRMLSNSLNLTVAGPGG